MQRIFTYAQLSPELQAAAVRRVAALALKRTESCGEVWADSALTIAQSARFHVFQGDIWNVIFAEPPRLAVAAEWLLVA